MVKSTRHPTTIIIRPVYMQTLGMDRSFFKSLTNCSVASTSNENHITGKYMLGTDLKSLNDVR